MCAIAGIYTSFNFSFDYSCVLKEMLELMKARGMDASYMVQDGLFHAGMNRLSINDLNQGSQPFMNHDESVWVFLNGEIYNHKRLKERLKNKIQLDTHCDGAILPFLYEQYGSECFGLLDGMFGIAIYDKRQQKIFLARDHMGEKPLYFIHNHQQFAFSSLIQPLKTITTTSLNHEAIWDFFTFGFIPEPKSIFNEITALPRGSYMEFDLTKHDYTIKPYLQDHFYVPAQDLVASVKEAVSMSVHDRLMGDVEIGAFLSGGLDSSIVSALAKQQKEHLHTFNIAFKEGKDPYCGFVDESVFAKEVASFLKTKHHEIAVDAQKFRAYLPSFIKGMDQPFGAVSGIGVKIIAEMAKEMGIKVLLSGDGADEFFGGYSWYLKLKFNDPAAITKEKPKGWHYYAYESEKRNLLNQEFFKHYDSTRYFPPSHSKSIDFIEFDRAFYLPFEMMVKVDRMCMSEGVEGRSCFVSPHIMQLTHNIDYDVLLERGEKWLLKEAFKDILPQNILTRPKHGFNVPIDDWIKKDWFDLLDLSQESVLFKMGIIHEKTRDHLTRLLFSTDKRVGNIAFFMIVLELWLKDHA